MSETLEPQELLAWLNEYMDAMARQVAAHNGIINKYIGDAIMALFGAPIARTTEEAMRQDAISAVRCGLAMSQQLKQLNQAWQAEGKPMLSMRIGILTGPLIAGSLGGAERLEYTVIGDTVNTAARLESYDKTVLPPDPLQNPCRILLGEATAQYVQDHFQLQYVDEVNLKGKVATTKVYHVVKPLNPNEDDEAHHHVGKEIA